MKKCPYCGANNDEQAKVCNRCKAALPHEEETEPVSEPIRATKKKLRSE